jgi:tRNA-dihydrouridine synthase B
MKAFPKLKSRIILAPMHEVTNLAFRLLCKKYGAGLVSTELLSANAIARSNKAAIKLAKTSRDEKPVAAQIFGQNTENLVKSAKILEKNFDIIDINFGCPSNRILEQGAGSALLKRKNKIKEIVKEVSENIQKPLTIKIRSGFKESINAVEIAKLCEPYLSAIILHPRTVEQGYSGKADWNIIKQVKQNVQIPVIGNGDVIDGKSAKKMLEQTGCDYAMIGRAAIGNPFIFKQINDYLKTEEEIRQSKKEKINDYFRYIQLTRKFNIFSIKDAKQKAIEFTKGLEGSKKLRTDLVKCKNFEEIEKNIFNLERK